MVDSEQRNHTDAIDSLINWESEDRTQEAALSINRQRGMLITINALQICVLFTETILYPFFPQVAAEKGLSGTQIGIVFSAFDISRFVSAPIVGSSLTIWSPKVVSIIGFITSVIACILFGFGDRLPEGNWFFIYCIAMRLIAGCGSVLLTVSSTSMLLKATSFSANTINGLQTAGLGIAEAFAPALGGAIYALMNYESIFWILGIVQGCVCIIFMIVVPRVEEKNDIKTQKKNFLELMMIPGCLLMFVHCAVVRITSMSRMTGISNWIASQFGTSLAIIGVLFAAWATVFTISCPITAMITKKGYLYQTMLFGWLSSVILWLLIGPSPLLDFIFHGNKYFWLTVISMAISDATQTALYIPPMEAALDAAVMNGYAADSLHTCGMVTGMIRSGLSLGAIVGPIIGGGLTDVLNFAWMGTLLAGVNCLMFLAMAGYVLYMKAAKQPLNGLTITNKSGYESLQDDE